MEQRRVHLKESSQLPEDVIVKILAKLPYPTILKTKCLSKRWAALFSSNPQEMDANAFREEVDAQASCWSSFNPLLIWKEGNRMVGYDMSKKMWQEIRVPSLGVSAGVDWIDEWNDPTGCIAPAWIFAGSSMLCWFGRRKVSEIVPTNGILSEKVFHKIVVMNVFTGAFKVLHSPDLVNTYICPRRSPRNKDPPTRGITPTVFHFLGASCRVYKAVQDGFIIVLIYARVVNGSAHQRVLQVYDSRRACWDTQTIEAVENREIVYAEHASLGEDHKLFIVSTNSRLLECYNLVDRTRSEVDLSSYFITELYGHPTRGTRVVLCGSRVFLVCLCPVWYTNELMHIELVLLEYAESVGTLSRVEQGYSIKMDHKTLWHCHSDLHHIHMNCYQYDCQIQNTPFNLQTHSYNLESGVWRTEAVVPIVFSGEFRSIDTTLSPGCNPFFYPSSLPD